MLRRQLALERVESLFLLVIAMYYIIGAVLDDSP
jgi:hypothetical protein